MKILQVSAFYSPFSGGSENFCRQLSERLVDRGHEVTVLTSRLGREPENENIGGVTVRRKWCAGLAWGVNPITSVLRDAMRSGADVIHAHSYIFLTSFQAAIASRLEKTPMLLHLHGGVDAKPPSNDFSTRMKFRLKSSLFDATLGRWTSQFADAVASVSKTDLDRATSKWKLDPSKVYWVPNAVDPSNFDEGLEGSHENVTFIGRLEAWKGIRTFLQVAKLVSTQDEDAKFLVAGDGSLRKDLERQFSDINVKFLGRVPHEDIPRVFRETAVLVLPSYMEGVPTVCLEALASGVPVVASDVGGTFEIIKNEQTGLLCNAGDTPSFAQGVLRLLSDKKLRDAMGRNGQKLVRSSYSWNTAIKQVESIYDSLAG